MKVNKTRFQMDVRMDSRLYNLLQTEADRLFKSVPSLVVDILTKALVSNNQKTSLTNLKSNPKPQPETQRELEQRLLAESKAEWDAMLARRGQE